MVSRSYLFPEKPWNCRRSLEHNGLRRRRPAAQRTVGTYSVVVRATPFDQHLRLQQPVEDLPIPQLAPPVGLNQVFSSAFLQARQLTYPRFDVRFRVLVFGGPARIIQRTIATRGHYDLLWDGPRRNAVARIERRFQFDEEQITLTDFSGIRLIRGPAPLPEPA